MTTGLTAGATAPTAGAGSRTGSDAGAGVVRATVVVGNPRRGSRTLAVAAAVLDAAAGAIGMPVESRTIELADYAGRLFDQADEGVRELTDRLAGSDLAIIASPTYKASYTGLLKAFLDRYQTNGLGGVVAVPVMVGAAPVHSLAVDVHLHPLLLELGATVPTRGLFVLEAQLDALDSVLGPWARAAGPALRALLAARQATTGAPAGSA